MYTPNDIARKIWYNLDNTPPSVNNIINLLKNNGTVLLFGGVVRDFLLDMNPRDYDIVVANSKNDLSTVFQDFTYQRNRFDGYKVYINNIKFDVWRLEDTWAFKQNLLDCNIRNLSKTVFFNADSVVYDLSENILYEDGFLASIKDNYLDIVLENNPFPSLCVLRSLVFNKRYGYQFSNRLIYYIYQWVNKAHKPINELYIIQKQHYQKIILNRKELSDYIHNIVNMAQVGLKWQSKM